MVEDLDQSVGVEAEGLWLDFGGRPHRGHVCANLTGTLTYKSGIPIAMANDSRALLRHAPRIPTP